MGKIRILDDHLANQIAAGEVVERPASVVKELVENAIDADADRIAVQLEEGGIRSIRVSDNGCGMDREDAQLAFARHATSKIRRERDLFAIRTLGFRGEALPSIASVSRLTLTTQDGSDQPAIRLKLEGGETVSIEETSRSRGTDVWVEDLFYNTPARLKYLKTVNTEVSHVADVIGRLALAHPNRAFSLRHNRRELFRTPGDGKLIHVIHALYGKQVASHMMPVEAEDPDFRLTGLVARPEVTRSNRSYLSIILNGRYIRSVPLVQAVLQAYDTLLPVGRYPIGVLCVETDPKLVDVNVHPAKLEVRISKEKTLYDLIVQSIHQALHRQVLVPKVEKKPNGPMVKKTQVVQERLSFDRPARRPESDGYPSLVRPAREDRVYEPSSGRQEMTEPVFRADLLKPANAPEQMPIPSLEKPEESSTVSVQETEAKSRFPMMEPLTQVHGTYIVAQAEDGFYLIDQHAAHERIYYERFLRRIKETDPEQQPLLVPMTVECSLSEAETIRSKLDDLRSIGLEVEPFGGTTFLVRSHPRWFPDGQEEAIIREILDWIKEHGRVDTVRLRDASAKLMACKAAIKANRYLRREEMERLLEELGACDNPFTCPHGRPILVHFSTYEIEKMFKRVM
ncbi:DNA mismatch repair endonuclease MutL [Polycladomyces subterraneus]|uniref:DNA mismatch repair protein MutL n=1 Tax=Polycladomyces subterraneus TaxID=1016997 RepID=A0ABT8IM28_9BACL|nr:DNA mismatch repair endonuclease MutL [Polycladomyces subterraneus]MDN4593843.1 DNA mismatch repair endonuclease MutL [Polycladomyces subterraneus]